MTAKFHTAAFLTQTVTLDDATVKFEIWDTAGQGTTRSDHAFSLTNRILLLPCTTWPLTPTTFWVTERYRSLAPMYYRGAAAAIVVFDITKKDSFNGAKSWVKELQRRGDPNVVIALAGNKADMESKRKVSCPANPNARSFNCCSLHCTLSPCALQVQTEEAQQYAQDSDIIYMETSAKTALNVRNLFVEIGEC